MSLGTNFAMHAHWQGFNEEHQRPANDVSPFLRDGDLDAYHLKVKASATKNL
jgi:hypothetical protein